MHYSLSSSDVALCSASPLTPRIANMLILTFESVDEILCCDHSNETSSAVLSHGTIYII